MTKIIITENQLKTILSEIKYREPGVYFETFSSAVQDARGMAEQRGYEIDENSWWNQISVGKGKPKAGETHRFTIDLLKNGKPQRKCLQIVIYNRGDDVRNNYELTTYIG